ncbi:hypothetical protein [Streptomyces sp. ID05-18]|uniref:hypothetical protein n=1 Tax=Streptomyces sp. ID05-18 TaxID=3028662 RepID=UPI0029BA053C|nr:hypothetical protein [Streptomyces sp. ID05-18]MDX3490980.1 hypothetical protein [Streptomyces sp. ID05-18]
MTTTAAPTAPAVPAPTTAPAPVVPPPTAPSLVTTTAPTAPAPVPPPAPVPVAASRRSVHLLAAAVGGLAVAGLLYVLVDRPGLREPLEAAATIVAAIAGVAGVVRGVSRAGR